MQKILLRLTYNIYEKYKLNHFIEKIIITPYWVRFDPLCILGLMCANENSFKELMNIQKIRYLVST